MHRFLLAFWLLLIAPLYGVTAKSTGDSVKADGEYSYPALRAGSKILVSLSGTFGGGTATIGYINASGAFTASQDTAGEECTFTAAGSAAIFLPENSGGNGLPAVSLTGSTSPSISVVITKLPDGISTAQEIGLGNVDDTSDADKPVSDDTQAELNGKAPLADGLANYRKNIAVNNFTRTSVLFFGDSMIGQATQNLRLANQGYLDETDMAWADASMSGGASTAFDDCTKWITGVYYPLTASGHTVTFGQSVTFPVPGNTLKIYYLKKSGGGTFKVQSEATTAGVTGSWTDEAGYTAVDTSNASDAGGVITITKSTYRTTWRVRCVWVSGNVDILGAGIVDTGRYGAKCAIMSNGSTAINNIDNASLTASAIVNPIMADLAPNLVVLSHLDGAAMVTGYQGAFQDKINTGITSAAAPTPSWIVVGPPSGYDTTTDNNNAAQASAQKTLATTRNDVFFDNRIWMGGVTAALANGYMQAADVHPTAKAQAYWVPSLYQQCGIANGLILGPKTRTSYLVAGSGTIRGQGGSFGSTKTMEIDGDIRMTSPYGETGKGRIYLEDGDGPANSNDTGYMLYAGNALKFGLSATARLVVDQPIGQMQIYDPTSTTVTPNGNLGIAASPFRAINLGKTTIAAGTTTSPATANTASGSVNLAAGATSFQVNNSLVSATSYVYATVGTNDSSTFAVRAVPASGSFTLYPNAAPAAETKVFFWVMP